MWFLSCLPFFFFDPKPPPPPPSLLTWDPLSSLNDPNSFRSVLSSLPDPIPISSLLLPDSSGEDSFADLTLTVDEVVAVATEADWSECAESLVAAFEFFDRDSDGVISADDLRVALKEVVGEEVERCERIVRVFDCEKVGGICFQDFLRLMTDGGQSETDGIINF